MSNCQYSECEKKYIKKHFKVSRSKKFKRNLICFFICFIFIIILLVYYLSKVVNPIMYTYGEATIQKLLTISSNNAIGDIISTMQYDDIVKIKYDDNGDVITIEAISSKINQISNNLAKKTQEEIDNSSKLGINIPIGTCSGIGFLSGKGNNINISIEPMGNASCNFYTTFEDAGINQTNHKIFVNIETEASLIMPFAFKKVKKSTSYLLAECIIVGKIPSVYLGTHDISYLK